jgi:hypothetical protein
MSMDEWHRRIEDMSFPFGTRVTIQWDYTYSDWAAYISTPIKMLEDGSRNILATTTHIGEPDTWEEFVTRITAAILGGYQHELLEYVSSLLTDIDPHMRDFQRDWIEFADDVNRTHTANLIALYTP